MLFDHGIRNNEIGYTLQIRSDELFDNEELTCEGAYVLCDILIRSTNIFNLYNHIKLAYNIYIML